MKEIGQRNIKWYAPEERLPDDTGKTDNGWFSPYVWIALSDDRVVIGQCLHKSKASTSKSLVHDWFYDRDDGRSGQLEKDIEVVAWADLTEPDHPAHT